MRPYEGGYDLGSPLISASAGERRVVVRYRRRFDHLWICEEDRGRILGVDALDAPIGVWRVGRETPRGGRYVIAGRMSREDPPSTPDVRARLASGGVLSARSAYPAWLLVLPEGVAGSEAVVLTWHQQSGTVYDEWEAHRLSDWLGDESPTRYAPLPSSPG